MSFFRRPDYKSDATLFIEQLKADKPGLEHSQRQASRLNWREKPMTISEKVFAVQN